jgi:hypothetical protein
VLVLPVTHSAPAASVAAIEIPQTIKHPLGLDSARSWIVLAEWNEFVWPGPDLRPVPKPVSENDEISFAYGMLSRGFFARVRDEFVATVRSGRATRVRRTE